jgi:hypothetical protein
MSRKKKNPFQKLLSNAGKALKQAAPVASMLASTGVLGPGAMMLNSTINKFVAPPSAQAAPPAVNLAGYMDPGFTDAPAPATAAARPFGLSPMVLVGIIAAAILMLFLLMR